MIIELDQKEQQQVVDETTKYIDLANNLFETNYPTIPITFDLKGHTIGMYKQGRGERLIRYNSPIFAKFFDANLRDTVPHEVAHYIVDMHYGARNIRPHGKEWRSMMERFNADASRTADYDLSDMPKRSYSSIAYRCDCKVHQLGIRRHNKVIQGKMSYSCRHCGDVLTAV
ncbi:MAG: metallopeptidase [Cycloclasticus sp. symbiont of Bathymodiolus heckerae]|nr:MAG: metallopeptidase [Cycloclasticus sp. symbiont of Bathymodiolus heckerae]